MNTSTVRPLISAADIAAQVASLGQRISDDYQSRPLTILGVLSGSLMFVADLMRQIQIPHQLGLLQASSYRGEATSPSELILNLAFLPTIQGRHILLVDDILDTGRTLHALCGAIAQMPVASVETAVLLWKKSRTVAPVVPTYLGFEIPDEFVVGYGLDYDGEYRHLPYIGVVESGMTGSAAT
jgi:hypoxanthine phosphoribosyltransferase